MAILTIQRSGDHQRAADQDQGWVRLQRKQRLGKWWRGFPQPQVQPLLPAPAPASPLFVCWYLFLCPRVWVFVFSWDFTSQYLNPNKQCYRRHSSCCQDTDRWWHLPVHTPLPTVWRVKRRFLITEKAPTRTFSWLKAATTAFTLKTLYYAKQALAPWSEDVQWIANANGQACWLV